MSKEIVFHYILLFYPTIFIQLRLALKLFLVYGMNKIT